MSLMTTNQVATTRGDHVLSGGSLGRIEVGMLSSV